MSTPCHESLVDLPPFDDEEMARETAKVLDALRQVQEEGGLTEASGDTSCSILAMEDTTYDRLDQVLQGPNDSSYDLCHTSQPGSAMLNDTQTLDKPVNPNRISESVSNSTQTLEPAPYGIQTVEHVLNSTQTLEIALNSTQTIEPAINSTQSLEPRLNSTRTLEPPLNSTQTLEPALNSTQTLEAVLNSTQTVEPVLNLTQPVEPQVNGTQILKPGSHGTRISEFTLKGTATNEDSLVLQDTSAESVQDSPEPKVTDINTSDSMKMSVDESCPSRETNSMAISSESLPTEELPLDATDSKQSLQDGSSQSETSVLALPLADTSAQMQVDEADGAKLKKSSPLPKEKSKSGKAGALGKTALPDRRKTLPAAASGRPTRLTKPRESLLPSAFVKPKEKEKSPEKPDAPTKVIQKSKPKSKWADISKQIEKNAKSPKPAPKPIQSKLSAAALRKPIERSTSVSSDISQTSQASATAKASELGLSKKPLKRHTLLPSSNAGQKQEFKKPRASLLPPPTSKGRGKAESKLKTLKIPASQSPATSNGNGAVTPNSGGPPPDVVSSNSLTSKAKQVSTAASDEKAKPKAKSPLERELEEALRQTAEKDKYAQGLKQELLTACRGVEGLGIVAQHLAGQIESTREELVRSNERSCLLTESHQQELLNHQTDTELLTKNHEEEKRAVIAQLMGEREKDRARHSIEYERLREDLANTYAQEVDSLQSKHEKQKEEYAKEIENLKLECCDWKRRYDEATEALHRNMEHKLQVAMQPYALLPQEIESLKTVVELKSCEIRDLRAENNVYKQKVETIPDLEKKLYDTQQKLENLQALLDIVSTKEKETAEKYHKITRKAVQEKKENHRLSLNVEALELKLEEAEFTNSIHYNDQSSDLDTSTASLPPYGIENLDTSPSQFTRSFSRSSIKRRSQRSSLNNNTAFEIPETERQISPAKHLVLRSPSTSPSPTRLCSSRKPQCAATPTTVSYSRASTLPRSYRSNKHQRCHSDSGRPV